MPTNLEFLEPGFDPRALKVPQLRRILTENNVQVPSKAKKNALIRLYNKDIVPQLDDLRDRYKDVKPSSKGIKKIKRQEMIEKKIEVKTKEEKTTGNEKKKRTRETVKKEDEEGAKQDIEKEDTKFEKSSIPDDHKNKKSKKAKKTKEAKHKKEHATKAEPTSEVEHVQTAPIKLEGKSDNSQKENKSIKREVLKPNLSKLKVSPEFATLLKHASARDEEKENKTVDTSKQEPQRKKQVKTKSQEAVDVVSDSEEEQIKTTDKNGKETKKDDEFIKTPEHPGFQWPKLRFKKSSEKTINAKQSDSKIKSLKSEFGSPKCGWKCMSFGKTDFKTFKHYSSNSLIFLLIAIPILYSIWYRQQRIAIGYCGRELPLKTVVPSYLQSFCQERFNINLSTIDNWLSVFKPNCLLCPQDSTCLPNMELTCHTQHRKFLPLLSLNKLIPISEYCIPEIKKQKFVDGMVSNFANLLQNQNAKLNCGGGENQELNSIPRSVLRNLFDQRVDSKWTSQEVTNLWELTFKKLNELPEVKTFSLESSRGNIMSIFVRSTSKEKISIICKYGDVTKARLYRHRYLLLAATSFIVTAGLLNCFIQRRVQYNDDVERNVAFTIKKLKAQTEHGKDGTFLHTLQLRDVVLADVVDLNERKKMWKSMTTLMKKNKEITCALTEINGEILECWSWKKDEVTEQ